MPPGPVLVDESSMLNFFYRIKHDAESWNLYLNNIHDINKNTLSNFIMIKKNVQVYYDHLSTLNLYGYTRYTVDYLNGLIRWIFKILKVINYYISILQEHEKNKSKPREIKDAGPFRCDLCLWELCQCSPCPQLCQEPGFYDKCTDNESLSPMDDQNLTENITFGDLGDLDEFIWKEKYEAQQSQDRNNANLSKLQGCTSVHLLKHIKQCIDSKGKGGEISTVRTKLLCGMH